MDDRGVSFTWDFLISYDTVNQAWAEWVAWELEAAGFTVHVQAWDVLPGMNRVHADAKGIELAARTVVVVSDHGTGTPGVTAAWQSARDADPAGELRKLLVVRAADVQPAGLLGQLVPIDVFEVPEDEARRRLTAAARLAVTGGRAKPASRPAFPRSVTGRSSVFPGDLSRVWYLPWQRNPNFVGRHGELTSLRQKLLDAERAVVALPQALHGLGGVGKTQLAVEYAYVHRADYDLVWWIPADQRTLVTDALLALARRLGVSITGQSAESVESVLRVLESGSFARWLIVVDNAVEPWDLQGLLQLAGRRPGGHVLVTSRNPEWSASAEAIHVEVLRRDESVRLLRGRAAHITDPDADRVAVALGDLPLALEQAGAWLGRSGMTATSYLDLLHNRTHEILSAGKPAPYPLPVAATWTLAANALHDPDATEFLRTMAFFGSEPVPTRLLRRDCPGPTDPWREVADDPTRFARVVDTVGQLGLVQVTTSGIVMHRLVQAVFREDTPADRRDEYKGIVHRLLLDAYQPDPTDQGTWPTFATLLPHVIASGMVDSGDERARQLVRDLPKYLIAKGDYTNSAALARRIHDGWATALGPEHADTLDAANSLAQALTFNGYFDLAKELRRDVLERCRAELGPDSSVTLDAAAGLAALLSFNGAHTAAEEEQQDVVQRCRRVHGTDHKKTLEAELQLASIQKEASLKTGNYGPVLINEQEALKRSHEIYGLDHPTALAAAYNVAVTLFLTGRRRPAQQLLEDVLDRRTTVLGENHPDTLETTLLVGVTRCGAYRRRAARRHLYQNVLERYSAVLGENHVATLQVAGMVADMEFQSGRPLRAYRQRADVLKRMSNSLGTYHPRTVLARRGLFWHCFLALLFPTAMILGFIAVLSWLDLVDPGSFYSGLTFVPGLFFWVSLAWILKHIKKLATTAGRVTLLMIFPFQKICFITMSLGALTTVATLPLGGIASGFWLGTAAVTSYLGLVRERILSLDEVRTPLSGPGAHRASRWRLPTDQAANLHLGAFGTGHGADQVLDRRSSTPM